jgi:glutamate/tyrosine decarboxylase-like PLP-dependent enzyme
MADDLTLDPADWEDMKRTFHAATDLCLSHMQGLREGPVWRPTPDHIKSRFKDAIPQNSESLDALLSEFQASILPYSNGNAHPRFWGWVHGGGSAAGAFGEMLAGFMNSNVGGRDHIATYVERQVIDWCKEIFSFPASASGILTSGTSTGTIIALNVARNMKADADVQMLGVASGPRMTGYASAEAHGCNSKAFDLLGLGRKSLRMIPVDNRFQMKPEALRAEIAADRASGCAPFVVIASVGTVNTGAIDDLEAIADICRAENLWLHIDGAFGGLARLTETFGAELACMSLADSIAFDFHKWLHVPYDAGCVLIKDEAAHRSAFSARREYLVSTGEGLAGGDPWFCDYGPELSRGFRALKIWFTFKCYGVERLALLIEQNCSQARILADLVNDAPDLELCAPVSLNIVCLRFNVDRPADVMDALNRKITATLQLQGIAAPSTTTIKARTVIRVCITNHRTRTEDLVLLTNEIQKIGRQLADALD